MNPAPPQKCLQGFSLSFGLECVNDNHVGSVACGVDSHNQPVPLRFTSPASNTRFPHCGRANNGWETLPGGQELAAEPSAGCGRGMGWGTVSTCHGQNASLNLAIGESLSVLIQSDKDWDRSVEYMKVFLWLLTLALAVMCFFLWVLARLEIPLLQTTSVQLPGLTLMLVASPNWLWFCPVPWIVSSLILSCRKEVSPVVGFFFQIG